MINVRSSNFLTIGRKIVSRTNYKVKHLDTNLFENSQIHSMWQIIKDKNSIDAKTLRKPSLNFYLLTLN